jgi:RND superfamily putative drug exporter
MVRRISGFAARRPLLVVVMWLAVVVAGFGIGGGVFGRLVGEVGTVPGSESGRAAERVDAAAPRPETITAVISGRPAGDPALRRSVASAIGATRAVPGVARVSEPLPSPVTGRALLVEVTLAPGETQEKAAQAAAERLRDVDGATVHVAGGPLSGAEFDEQAQADVARAEMLSMPVVLVLLLVVFGGLLAAGLPLLIAVIGAILLTAGLEGPRDHD